MEILNVIRIIKSYILYIISELWTTLNARWYVWRGASVAVTFATGR